MHPILLMILLLVAIAVTSFATAIGLGMLVPGLGPLPIAFVGLLVGVVAVFGMFLWQTDPDPGRSGRD